MGILVNTGFDVGSSNPIDNRTLKDTVDERDTLVSEGKVYENLKVYCKDTQTEYRWTGTEWEEVGTGGTGGTVDLSGYAKTYTGIGHLNSAKGTSIELVGNTDNTLKIVEALGKGEEFVEWFGNTNSRFGLDASAGDRINYLRIQKTNATNGIILAVTDYGKTFSRVYDEGTLKDWCWDKSKATLVTNTSTLKLDVTKRNAAWYGAIKLTYLYDTSAVEIEINFRGISDDLRWAVINGQKYINKITFTQDSNNKAHYTIGIEFSATTYGNYQAEVIGGFADINSLTSKAFTGEKTAIYYTSWGKNLETQVNELFQSVSNGKSLVANAITGKGVLTSSTATFATMATNISKIQNVNSVSTYKEETKSSSTSMTSMTSMSFTFSAKVLGVKKIIAPKSGLGSSTPCNVVAAMSDEAISITGKSVTLYVNGSGTWKVTALIEA